jgi:hypothetical protein
MPKALELCHTLIRSCNPTVIKALITDKFVGTLDYTGFTIAPDIFLLLFPSNVLPKDLESAVQPYIESGVERVDRMIQSAVIEPVEVAKSRSSTGEIMRDNPRSSEETGGTEKQSFYEGEILETVLNKLKGVLENSLEENLLVTGILSCLSAVPPTTKPTRILHCLLLEPISQFNRSEQSQISILKTISYKLEFRSHDIVNLDTILHNA